MLRVNLTPNSQFPGQLESSLSELRYANMRYYQALTNNHLFTFYMMNMRMTFQIISMDDIQQSTCHSGWHSICA